ETSSGSFPRGDERARAMTEPHRPGPSGERSARAEPLALASAAALACGVFAGAYALFRFFQPAIVRHAQPSLPDFTPWVRWDVVEQDGHEVPVVLAGLLACIGLCIVSARRGLGQALLARAPVRWACWVAAGAILLEVRSSEFAFDARSTALAAALALGVL